MTWWKKLDNLNNQNVLGAADDLAIILSERELIKSNKANMPHLKKIGRYDLYRAKKSASFEDFIEMVNRLISKIINKKFKNKFKVEFSPDEGSKTKVSATESLTEPHIQFSIISRIPQPNSIKPRPREEFTEKNPDGTDGRKGIIYSQIFDYIIQFDILASDYSTANAVMNYFEDAMFNYTSYFKENGVSELLFLKQYTDANLDVYRNTVSVRSLQYRVSIEKNRLVYDTELVELGGADNGSVSEWFLYYKFYRRITK